MSETEQSKKTEYRDIRKSPKNITELEAVERAGNFKDFFRHGWKPLIATAFCAVIIFDFIIAPWIKFATRPTAKELADTLKGLSPEIQKSIVDHNLAEWSPLTLSDAYGVFFVAICAILAGVALYGHKGKQNE
jgi:hypothetical protein